MATERASNVTSASTPCSPPSTIMRIFFIGSTTSTLIGPTSVWARSIGARPEAYTFFCRPSWMMLKAASITCRFGYRPIAPPKNTSPSGR